MITKAPTNAEPALVQPEHRALFRGLADSTSIDVPPQLRHAFLEYGKKGFRGFPWREPGMAPYPLLLAELLLVQTKASDVALIWPKLINRYPTPALLARATVSALSKLLRPLGLQNQRTKALRSLAKYLEQEWAGRIPSNIIDLLSLPHVGLYAAAAVSCFGHGERIPIVDTNVLRVLTRIFGLPIQRELRRSRKAWAIAWALLPKEQIKEHNYALLDFAAQVCTPKSPKCTTCHIKTSCVYGLARPVTQAHKDNTPTSDL